ncbi:chromosome segregation protein Spc25-domain-containing protein [Crassisporium funariophilum]|nr:chromosome segregation protein Spc25-domain-containing protein [Crassisporium funariophilum]
MAHGIRLPQIDLSAILSQQNPNIDLRLNVYEHSTRNFLKALTSYKNRAITTISDRRKHQASERKKVSERTQAVEAETSQCKQKEIELVAHLEREKDERKDAELLVAAFKRQLAALRDKCASIDADIEHYRAIAQNLRREKNKERSTLSSHALCVPPELEACERRLSCFIEGVEADRLLVRFSNIDQDEINREASFVIDLSNRAYKVITSSPHLPSMLILVSTLNEDGDIYGFIKEVHNNYKLMLRGGTL